MDKFFTSWVVLFVMLIVIASSESEKCTNTDARNIYDSCALDYRYMALWCDYTNFSSIPDPEDIQSQAPCGRAVHLYFNNSCLREINPSIIQKYVSLTMANFSDNLLTKINSSTFSTAKYLKILDLSRNNISAIGRGAFQELHKLQKMVIDSNKLGDLSHKWFPKKSMLEELSIQNNSLSLWFTPKRSQFSRLNTIKANGNQVQRLEKRNFSHMKKLREVSFSHNKLKHISHDVFHDSPELDTVDLSHNELDSLPKRLFEKNCQLKLVKLDGNHITTLHVDWFVSSLRNNEQLSFEMVSSLKSNLWNCDCQMLAYWEFLQELSLSPDDAHQRLSVELDVECVGPEENHGSNLRSISREQLTQTCKIENVATPHTKSENPILKRYNANCQRPSDLHQAKAPSGNHTPIVSATVIIALLVVLIIVLTGLVICWKRNNSLPKKRFQNDERLFNDQEIGGGRKKSVHVAISEKPEAC